MHTDTASGKYILFTFLKSVTSLSSSFPSPESWEGKEREPQRPTPHIQRRTPWLTPANQSERNVGLLKGPRAGQEREGLVRWVSREEKDKEWAGQLKGLESSPTHSPPFPSAPCTSAGGERAGVSLYPLNTRHHARAAANGQVSGHKTLSLCGLLMLSPPGRHLCGQKRGVKLSKNLRPMPQRS